MSFITYSLRCLADGIDSLPAHTLRSLLFITIPLILAWFYRKYVHIPAGERSVEFEWIVPPEASLGWRSKAINKPSILSHLKDSSLLPSTTSDSLSYITCYAPASGHHLATIHSASQTQITSSITAAAVAQFAWRKTSFAERRKVMRSLLYWCVKDMLEISRVASRDTGKTLVDAAFGEILTTVEKLRWVIANGEEILEDDYRPTNLLLAHKVSKVVYEPLGVVAAIVSWNYPFHNLLSPMIAALFTGNAIVLKPSEAVAWSSHSFITAVHSCLIACGHSPDLVQIITCLPDAVEALTGDDRIRHITFIGSEEVGRLVAIKGAKTGTPVLLELGGKDPCIVLPSADVGYFADTFMRGAFQASGQNCIGIERFIVAEELYDDFVGEMTVRVKKLIQNDILSDGSGQNKTDLERTDVGAMVTDRLFPKLEELIQAAVKDGARLLVGGKRFIHKEFPQGHYFQPTLLVDVTVDMEIAQQEVFAPLMTVMKFGSLNEAISIANSTRYGLGASVFGKSQLDCRYVVERVNAGMICTNDFGVFYLNQSLPFGGTKLSGHGRFAGKEGLLGLCSPKAITEDRFHASLQTGIPPLLAYPINSGEAAWQFVNGLVRMAYAMTWREKGKGLWQLVMAGKLD